MSDLSANMPKTDDMTGNKTSTKPQSAESGSVINVNVNNPPPDADLLTTPEGKALAEKIRTEEKQKLYERLQRAEEARKHSEEQQKQLLASQEKLQKELEAAKKGSAKSGDIEAKLAALKEEVEKAHAQKEVVMQEAARMIKESEYKAKMQTLRERRILEEGVLLADTIPENPESIEVLEEAIAKAKAKQTEIEERARAKVREELGMNVPGPLAPETKGSGPGGLDLSHPLERSRIARLGRDDYEKVREELLKRAEQATGWNRFRPLS